MTRDLPNGEALLVAARRLLLEELLDLLPADRRYDGLMIANALGIATRELGDGGAAGRAAGQRLAEFYGETVAAGEADDRLEHRLAADIRAGRFDSGEPRRALLALLRAELRDRLAISNPKVLRV